MSGAGGPLSSRRDMRNPATALRTYLESFVPGYLRSADWAERFDEMAAMWDAPDPFTFLASDDMGAAMVRFPIDTDGNPGAL